VFAALKHFFITKKETLKCLQNSQFLNYIVAFEKHFSKTQIARFLKVSPQTIRAALKRKAFACTQSVVGLCHKKYFQQLTPKEVEKIKSYCEDEKYKYWSLRSVYYQGLRDAVFQFHETTFYKYPRILGITRKSKKNYRPNKGDGIKSSRVNEYWCADVTIFKTKDNVKHYIYFVIDHFSKKILSYKIADKICGITRAETFKMAVEYVLSLQEQKSPDFKNNDNINSNGNESTLLVVDGGVENNNAHVDTFLSSVKEMIRKVVALKDIVQSNSPIEAFNKTIKNDYLNKMELNTGEDLKKALEFALNDYDHRPHGSIHGYTPNEYHAQNLPQINRIFKDARLNRRVFNRNFCCINKT
jgi:putative transposase